MRNITKLIVHCSATSPEMDIDANAIDSWHRDRGWNQIGYHFVIKRDGTIEKGRDIDVIGAHAKGYNAQSIGICLIGGVDNKNNPEQNFTANQYYSLKILLDVLLVMFPASNVIGHNDVSKKPCPSFDVIQWWNQIV